MKLSNFKLHNSYLDPSVENYIMHGLPPGGFLTAVLAGDYEAAAECADAWNQLNLPHIMHRIEIGLPSQSIGSYEAINNWLNDIDGVRSTYVNQVNKIRVFNRLSGLPYNAYILDDS
tara:strand:- start:57 stop:407 length:351 start_codon:yes stop_codon:yes gene_type:complete